MDDAQAFLNILGGRMTNLFCARQKAMPSRGTPPPALASMAGGGSPWKYATIFSRRPPTRCTRFDFSRETQVKPTPPAALSASPRDTTSRTCTVWKSTPNRRAFLISHSANWCFEIPLGVFRRNPTGKCPRRHPMRGEHDMAFHIPFRLRIPHGRHVFDRGRAAVVLEDRIIDYEEAATGIGEACVLQDQAHKPPHHPLGRPGGPPRGSRVSNSRAGAP